MYAIRSYYVERGLARVYTFPDNRGRIAEMLAAEDAARRAKRGLWALPAYRVRAPEEAAPGGFLLIEGRVLAQSRGDGPTYLNFGRTWIV